MNNMTVVVYFFLIHRQRELLTEAFLSNIYTDRRSCSYAVAAQPLYGCNRTAALDCIAVHRNVYFSGLSV